MTTCCARNGASHPLEWCRPRLARARLYDRCGDPVTKANDERAQRVGINSAFPRQLPPGLQALNELALNLRWTWSHASDRLWQTVDRWTWAVTRNPWFILQTISDFRLQHLARDKAFRAELEELGRQRDEYLSAPGWYG